MNYEKSKSLLHLKNGIDTAVDVESNLRGFDCRLCTVHRDYKCIPLSSFKQLLDSLISEFPGCPHFGPQAQILPFTPPHPLCMAHALHAFSIFKSIWSQT
jgi:hypothetical protein